MNAHDRSDLSEALKTTCWTALGRGDVEYLVRAYWRPISRFLKQALPDPSLAEDVTQEFFLKFLEKDFFRSLDPNQGKFRNLLFLMARRFAIDFHRKRKTQRRGGALRHQPIDDLELEDRAHEEPSVLFDRQWFLSLLQRARDLMRYQYKKKGKDVAFEAFRLFYLPDRSATRWSQSRIAEHLGITVAAANNYIHRGKKEFAGVLRELVEDYAAGREEVEEELRDLARFLDPRMILGTTSTSGLASPAEDP